MKISLREKGINPMIISRVITTMDIRKEYYHQRLDGYNYDGVNPHLPRDSSCSKSCNQSAAIT